MCFLAILKERILGISRLQADFGDHKINKIGLMYAASRLEGP